jgi:hypothetical protein
MSLQDVSTRIIIACKGQPKNLLYGVIAHELAALYNTVPNKGEITIFMLRLMQEYCNPKDQAIYIENLLRANKGGPIDMYAMAVKLIKEHEMR